MWCCLFGGQGGTSNTIEVCSSSVANFCFELSALLALLDTLALFSQRPSRQPSLWVRERPPAAAVNPLQLIWWPICLAPNGELFPGRVPWTHACMHPGADTRARMCACTRRPGELCTWRVLAMHTATHACIQAQACVHAYVRARTHASPW